MDPIPMKFPFTTAAGQKIESVATRRLKVRNLRAISEKAGGNPAQIELLGVAWMVDMIPEDLDEMDAADYQAVKGRFLEFVGITEQPVAGQGTVGQVVPDAAK